MKIEVLDHGYVEFVEAWGTGHAGKLVESGDWDDFDSEVGIIEAARQSTQGNFRGWEPAACDCGPRNRFRAEGICTDDCASKTSPGDSKLLSYLFHNNHSTPFEFSGMVIEVQAPIFVFREWHRHRTQSYNEMSARYAPLPDLNYIPSTERIMKLAGANKQAQGTGAELNETAAAVFRDDLRITYAALEREYQQALSNGVPKELARLVIPVGRYSKMRASCNLRNWLQFLSLRADPLAQWEIRQYACAVGLIIKDKFPRTYSMLHPSQKLVIENSL